jgi:hypothetical protein
MENNHRKVISYTVVSGWESDFEFNKEVERLLNSGWQPFGGVSSTRDYGNLMYSQAFAKYDK